MSDLTQILNNADSYRESEEAEYAEMEAAKAHCRKIKQYYNKTKGSMTAKREQHTTVPISFWKLIESMLMDSKIQSE